jgi:hypothetical protein
MSIAETGNLHLLGWKYMTLPNVLGWPTVSSGFTF